MANYISVISSGIGAYTGDSADDGRQLACQCLDKLKRLDDPEQFPPRLLILLTSPAYLDLPRASNLLESIHQTYGEAGYRNVSLIGCSTAAVFFNRRVYREGAVLVCLASRLLDVKIAVGHNATEESERAINQLLGELKIAPAETISSSPPDKCTLFSFLPGFDGNRYPAPLLHQLLRDNLPPEVQIFGGAASADDPDRMKPGILFADREIHRNAVVAASVMTGTPVGISLSQGLTDTGRLLQVSDYSEDRRSIFSFHEGSAANLVKQREEAGQVVLMAEIGAQRDLVVDTPKLSEDGRAIQMTRTFDENSCFKILQPDPAMIYLTTRNGILQAIAKAQIENPVACLAFKCIGLLRQRQKIGLDFEMELDMIEHALIQNQPNSASQCFGAFLDGEAGVDEFGKSLLSNWSTAALLIGDELTGRVPAFTRFAKLADLAKASLANPEQAIIRLVEFIHALGFRGAMLSFWMPDQQEEVIIAKAATGSRYKRIMECTRRPISGDDVVVLVAKEKRPRFIPDSRLPESHCDPFAISQSGIISQYLLPLLDPKGKVTAVLQFDLGDVSHKQELLPAETEALNAIGDIVIAILNRVHSNVENQITRRFDQALEECISAETVNEGLQKFLELTLQAFGLEGGHIRLAQEDRHSLSSVVGVGKLYEKTKGTRNEIDFGEISPLARAFREEAPIIVNDAANNIDHQWMCERYKEKESNKALYADLKSIASYANVPFVTEGGERGTISLFANSPWFFTWFHTEALKVLGAKIGFLLENLRRKYSEKFLLSINPRLPRIQALDDLSKILANVTERFARSINAEFAELFLWDEDQELYILRAQYGWHEPEWVNAARYRKGDTWAGSSALAGAPRHLPNLFRYYEENRYSERGHYNQQVFGRELSEKFTVEAIGLPLRITDDQIGVMTLYRQIKDRSISGFLTTDPKLLTAGAASLTGLVKLFQSNSFERWEKEELNRHQKIYEACTNKDDRELFEERVCQQTLECYRAISADFYSLEPASTPKWKAGLRRSPKTGKISRLECEAAQPLSLTDVTQIIESKIPLAKRREVSSKEMKTPRMAAIAGLVERVIIPLSAKNQLLGLLDLRWLVNHRSAIPAKYRHSREHLRLLGEKIGMAYQQHQLEKSQEEAKKMKEDAERLQRQTEMMRRELDERSELAVKATGAYVFQSLHRLANVIQTISSLPIIIKETTDEQERENGFRDLKEAIVSASKMVESVKDVGERVIRLHREKCYLAELIRRALDETRAGKTVMINIDQPSIENVIVQVDPEHTKEILVNLINNAVEAMRESERQELMIRSSALSAGNVTISIRDTGKGMTEEEIQAAERGFVSTRGHKGVGVLITRVLLNAQRGTLTYRSIKNIGTEAIITLPLA